MRTRRNVLVCLAAAGLLIGACGDDGGTADEAADSATTTAAGDEATTEPADDATESSEAATVQVAGVPEFGEILVGPNGHTLYLFEKDQGTTTACTGGCASAWPALAAAGQPTAGDGVDAAKLATAEGQVPNQVVYNGHLLYFFAQDKGPGDVKGIEVPAWFPLNAAGEKVEGAQG